ncbi:hypothetical protein HIM_06815 [Hirsutella minnesotensis 3608]|uniref:Benzoate 4-monooxygenase cytochrome P450 n=1 Tax=Hirsutella minnesotensis 3608 TaxID=1043627 RepID=A0A0F7ZZ68_9HYPO|nr:hypothetical protein HIM_06815 [Hirsutella minnesotensis 3608]
MMTPYFHSLSWLQMLAAAAAIIPILFIANCIYNLFFHPLARIPGPLLGRMTGITSWYYAMRGKRHIWLWQQFQIHGNRIRATPNTVLFCDPSAYAEIYGNKSNVRRSHFYTAFRRKHSEPTTLNTIDVAVHAQKRKLLNVCFTDKLVRAASPFIARHVDRWNQLMVDEINDKDEWSAPVNFAHKVDELVFDIIGDLSFGRSFDIKEPRNNPLKQVPHFIAEYMKFYYPICRSPLLNLIIWLKPRGLDALMERLAPPNLKYYNDFLHESVTYRIALQKLQAEKPESERCQDIFYFLYNAKDPDTGRPAYSEDELRGECSLLIIAGSDTTSVSLSGVLFYLTDDSWRYQKLAKEIMTTFDSVDDIVYGPKLASCKYLKACIDEGMRLAPSGPCELPREVLPGGIVVMGEYYPAGTVLGSVPWVDSRNKSAYGDAEVFRPERWIVDEKTGVTKTDVDRARANFHPFAAGPGNCVGKNLALTEMAIVIARTLYRLDVRRAPGSTVGGGSPELGWGARDPKQFQLRDAYISLREGPEVQFRKRVRASTQV